MIEDTDAALVRECRQGDRIAFVTLLNRYEKKVFNAAFRILNDSEDASDVTQTVFLKALENLHHYNPEYKFFSWIYRITVNESINVAKKRHRFEPVSSQEAVATAENPEKALENDQLGQRIQAALMACKAEHRVVIVLKHFLGCSYREMSLILEIPEKTVKSRLFTARQHLREALSTSGIVEK